MKISVHPLPFVVCLLAGTVFSLASSARAQTAPTGTFFDEFFTDHLSMPGDNVPGNNTAIPSAQGFVQWAVTGGSVDLVGGVVPLGLQPDTGGRFVDLGGSTGQPGRFATNPGLNFLAGVTYNLSFLYVSTGTFLNANVPTTETARVAIAGLSFDVSTNSGAFQQFSQNFSFPTLTAAALAFQDLGPFDNSGLGIDRVMIMPAAATVPEPGSLALLAAAGAALGAGGWLARHRRRSPLSPSSDGCARD